MCRLVGAIIGVHRNEDWKALDFRTSWRAHRIKQIHGELQPHPVLGRCAKHMTYPHCHLRRDRAAIVEDLVHRGFVMLRYVKADLGLERNPGGADSPAQAEFSAGTRRSVNSGRRRAASSSRPGIQDGAALALWSLNGPFRA